MPEASTQCDWCATDPTTGRFGTVSHRSDAQALLQRIETLRRRGTGYTEVARPEQPFPTLALSFSGDHGVVHQFASPDESLLLRGDGSLGATRHVEVLIHDEMHPFSGAYVSTIDQALDVVMQFVAGTEPAELGDWDVL